MSSYFLWPKIMVQRPVFSGAAPVTIGSNTMLVGRQGIVGSSQMQFGAAITPVHFDLLTGEARMTFYQLGRITPTPILIGLTAATFSPAATLRKAKKMAGASAMTFGQAGVLTRGVDVFAGSSGMVFDGSALMRMAEKMEGSAGMEFSSEDCTLRAKVKMAGESSMSFGVSATLKARKKLAGAAAMTFGQNASITAFPPVHPTSDPEVWWSMDEGGGGYEDLAGEFTLTKTFGVSNEGGVVGNAARLGNGAALVRLSGQSTPNIARSFSFCGWSKPNAYPTSLLLLLQIVNDGGIEMLNVTTSVGGGTVVRIADRTGVETLDIQEADVWFFWTVTYDYDANQLKLYIDGMLKASQTSAGDKPSGTYAGSAYSGGGFFAPSDMGFSVDETAMFPSVLSESEVRWLHNYGLGRAFADL